MSRVERVTAGGRSWIRKTYSPAPFFLWRTFLARSKARREHDNLRALLREGVRATTPVAWTERRHRGCVPQCSLWLVDARARNLREALAGADPSRRRGLVAAYGRLLRGLHAAGFVSLTAYPRNVLVADGDALLFCDQPYLLRGRVAAGGALARIDLYDALFTPGRRRTLSGTERWRALLAYFGEERSAARACWRCLARRQLWRQRLHKGWLKIRAALAPWSRRP